MAEEQEKEVKIAEKPDIPPERSSGRVKFAVERVADKYYSAVEKKEFAVGEGKGTKLDDIDNVKFLLSKISPKEDIIKDIHQLIFRRPAKPHLLKKNILAFSGFYYPEPEYAKQRAVTKDKLSKWHVKQLQEVATLLDMNRKGLTKEELTKEGRVEAIMAFLDAPSANDEAKDLAAADEKRKAQKKRKAEKALKKAAPAKKSKKVAAAKEEEEDDEAPPPPPPKKKPKTEKKLEPKAQKPKPKKAAPAPAAEEEEDKDDDLPLAASCGKAPSDSELQEAVAEHMKAVDINTFTLSMMLEHLVGKFPGHDSAIREKKKKIKGFISELL